MPNGQPNTKETKGRASQRRTRIRREVFGELVAVAAEQGASIRLGVSTADAMQECLDRAVALWRFAADQVDRLVVSVDDSDPTDVPPSEPGGGTSPGEAFTFFEELPGPGGSVVVQPNRWYLMEQEARRDVEKLAGMMTQLGIAERTVRVEEAKATLVIAAIRDAAIESGLSNDQVVALGRALRGRLDSATGIAPFKHESGEAMRRAQNPAVSREVSSFGPGHGPAVA